MICEPNFKAYGGIGASRFLKHITAGVRATPGVGFVALSGTLDARSICSTSLSGFVAWPVLEGLDHRLCLHRFFRDALQHSQHFGILLFGQQIDLQVQLITAFAEPRFMVLASALERLALAAYSNCRIVCTLRSVTSSTVRGV
jgi:hypothetical protein